MEQKSRAALMADALMGYAQKGGEGLMRGVRAANQALDVSQYLAPKDVAGFLPGAGFVQGAQDAQSARDEFNQGNYGRAVGYGAQSLLNTGLEMLPLTAALPAVSMMNRAADLPMDEASRMARATDQGFTVDAYHGGDARYLPKQLDAFSGNSEGGAGTFFSSSDPRLASRYAPTAAPRHPEGGAVMPLKLNTQNYLEAGFTKPFPDTGNPVDEARWFAEAEKWDNQIGRMKTTYFESQIARAREAGKDGVIIRNFTDYPGAQSADHPSDIFISFANKDGEPQTVRSRFAAFDPAKKNSRDLLASMAAAFGIPPAALMAQALMQQNEEPI